MIQATSSAAFTVEFPYDTENDPVTGPGSIHTQMLTVLSGCANPLREWVFALHDEARRGRILWVFREEDRDEVTKRFASIGVVVPARAEAPR